ncbi:MAG: nickel-binding protein [Chryseolinea sp.]
MTNRLWLALTIGIAACSNGSGDAKVPNDPLITSAKHDLFMEVHNAKTGSLKFDDVVSAPEKDLAMEEMFNDHFIKYWLTSKGKHFFDVYRLGAGSVPPKEVAEAHSKDLPTQNKHGVNFVHYWIDVKDGIVMCIAEAPDSYAMVKTHKDAHRLIPDEAYFVLQRN